MFPKNTYFAPRSPGTHIHMFSSNFVCLISTTSDTYSLTRNPTPPAPLFFLSCPFLVFPIHAYSPTLHQVSPPVSPKTLEIPLYIGHTRSSISSLLGSSVANPHTFHDPILRSFLFHYQAFFCLLFVLRRYHSYSRFFYLSFFMFGLY